MSPWNKLAATVELYNIGWIFMLPTPDCPLGYIANQCLMKQLHAENFVSTDADVR